MRTRAVVFDLWNTLVDWPLEESNALRRRWAEHLGVPLQRLDELWYGNGAYRRRETAPLASVVRELCDTLETSASVDELIDWRLELTRRTLAPAGGVLEALVALRTRGLRLGLISNCTEDVAVVWPETPFAPAFDVAVFSAVAGCMKPERRIYELAAEGLAVEPAACLFVGDGANDELRGAREAGMRAALMLRPGEAPPRPEARDWRGPRVTSVADVLRLVA